jgi:hypothetical protein
MRKTALFAVTVVWGIAAVLSFFVGRNYENQKIAAHLRKQQRQAMKGRFGPGGSDPRRGR